MQPLGNNAEKSRKRRQKAIYRLWEFRVPRKAIKRVTESFAGRSAAAAKGALLRHLEQSRVRPSALKGNLVGVLECHST